MFRQNSSRTGCAVVTGRCKKVDTGNGSPSNFGSATSKASDGTPRVSLGEAANGRRCRRFCRRMNVDIMTAAVWTVLVSSSLRYLIGQWPLIKHSVPEQTEYVSSASPPGCCSIQLQVLLYLSRSFHVWSKIMGRRRHRETSQTHRNLS